MEAAARAGGRREAALIRAFCEAREAGDTALMAEVAAELPSSQRFGAHPGQIPALVHEAYAAAADPVTRARLAAALGRAWVYGGDAQRAARFADEAVAVARGTGQPEVLAGALDAALLTRWGPGDFSARLQLAAELDGTTAHLADPGLRLSAHLWRLTTAWECLDVIAVRRQLRALDLLAAETGDARTAFFASARRAMHALATGELAEADDLIARTAEAGARAAEPDLDAVLHSLAASRARRAGDVDTLRREAAAFEAYGATEGIPSVAAEAAVLWLAAREPERALAVAVQAAGGGLDTVAQDVDFLLTVASLAEVGAALHSEDLTAAAARLLEPYAGRAVLNAGAVTFHGVVDDYLFRASQALGQPAAAGWRDLAATCYQRIGAGWWLSRLTATRPGPRPAAAAVIHLRQDGPHSWTVGRDGATAAMPNLRGLHYLRHLISRPGVPVAALELAAAVHGHPGAAVPGSAAGEVIDRQALTAYRRRLRELDAEVAEAQAWADEARLSRLRPEREALLREVGAATGLAGRPRRFSAAGERARVAVRKAVAAALARIGGHDPALARLLSDTVHTGASCRYDPDPDRPVSWQLGTGQP